MTGVADEGVPRPRGRGDHLRYLLVLPPKAGWRGLLRSSDVGLAYALVVVGLAVVLALQPDGVHDRLVLESSTNLANLRDRPLIVLGASAFVLDSTASLWAVPVLVVAYGALQRWLGRGATLLVAAFGHVFATVFVAVLLAAGIEHHRLARSLARATDVGVSYALAAVLGVLVSRLGPRWRRPVGLGGLAWLTGVAFVQGDFTGLGHLVAWGIGIGTGAVGSAMARAQRVEHDGSGSGTAGFPYAPAPAGGDLVVAERTGAG